MESPSIPKDKITSSPGFISFSTWFEENYHKATCDIPSGTNEEAYKNYYTLVVDITRHYNHAKGFGIPIASKTISTYLGKMCVLTQSYRKKTPAKWMDKTVAVGWVPNVPREDRSDCSSIDSGELVIPVALLVSGETTRSSPSSSKTLEEQLEERTKECEELKERLVAMEKRYEEQQVQLRYISEMFNKTLNF